MKRSCVWILFSFLAFALPAFSRGDKCIPQVVDGSDYHTKFDLVNISPQQSISGTFKLRFFHSDGTLDAHIHGRFHAADSQRISADTYAPPERPSRDPR